MKRKILYLTLFLLSVVFSFNSVLGSGFQGNVLLRYPRVVVNMENGERELSEPKVEIPRTLHYWSPPDFNLGDWKCEFTRDDMTNSEWSIVLVKCYIGNKFSGEGKSIGFLHDISCGKFPLQHTINLWTEGVDRHISIYCDGW